MKNHKRIDGQLLQTNKKWSHLKQSQKDWINQLADQAVKNDCENYPNPLNKRQKEKLVDGIVEKIRERDIWLPEYELYNHLNKIVSKKLRKFHNKENNTENGAVFD